MDFKQFKPKNGEKYIIIEDGQPMAVILSFEDYQKMVGSNPLPAKEFDFVAPELPEEVNTEEETPTGHSRQEEVEELKNELKRELTVDDLPF